MIDLCLFVEVCWVWLWIRTKSAERALLYMAAILTSMYVALHLTPWFVRTFIQTGAAFSWLLREISLNTHAVGWMQHIVPPVPTSGVDASTYSRWLSLQVLHTLVTILMAWAVFMVFVAADSLAEAVWDEPEHVQYVVGERMFRNLAGMFAGLWIAATTLSLLVTLDWIQPFQPVAEHAIRSLSYQGLDMILRAIPGLRVMIS
ncbi:hypothetical protein C7445_11524 [Alicyclobacillus sacchari]|uniref:Colicin V production protein n=1 Tax=Alicyclobacillus sacchari TaxID=392010 RepID=A0A4R8LGW2_9BACL|nr:hypothetical protein [Alicyclobacillus sacchari]TDY42393.1 hypothetical protein C7445_11524 [Alicyclobacillus sacchari]GMA57329.1 hypothetical protein GCM10025858_18320 [Alicyclobacillus sacchari]